MNTTKDQLITEILTNKKGSNLSAVWRRPVKTKKACTDIIEKETTIICRGGIEYDNTVAVQDKRDAGELPAENAGLPEWQEWVNYPTILRHKGNGTLYARFFPAAGIPFKPKTRFFKNGVEVAKSDVEDVLLASEKSNGEIPLCYSVKIESVVELGKVVL